MDDEEALRRLATRTGTRSRAVMAERMTASLHSPTGITATELVDGRVHGVVYKKEGTYPTRGILLAHGLSGSRHAFGTLCNRLADQGYLCLSIDMPSHGDSNEPLTIGATSETILDGVALLRKLGCTRNAIIGHSIGAIGALFANAGYNQTIEHQLYTTWECITSLLEQMPVDADPATITAAIEDRYTRLKDIMLASLKNRIQRHTGVSAYVLLAPPLNCKTVVPAVSLLRRLSQPTVRKLMWFFWHGGALKALKKEGIERLPVDDGHAVMMQYFKIADVHEFLDYLIRMKEPADFLRVIEAIAAFRHKDTKTGFFEYYQARYLYATPKLFIYGQKDLLLRPFIPFMRGRLERFYKSCGNATVNYYPFSHLMLPDDWQQASYEVMKDKTATIAIMDFLAKNV